LAIQLLERPAALFEVSAPLGSAAGPQSREPVLAIGHDEVGERARPGRRRASALRSAIRMPPIASAGSVSSRLVTEQAILPS
jgi:hypothetical protein